MPKQLFPKEFIRSSLEHYTFKIKGQHNGVYLTVLIGITSLFFSLPYIFQDVTTLDSGSIDTQSSRFEISAPTAGWITANQLIENQTLMKGSTLLVLDNSSLTEELEQVKTRLEELAIFQSDLNTLLNRPEESQISSARYQIEYLQYLSRLDQLKFEKQTLEVISQRQRTLFNLNVIAQVEYDRDKANHERAIKEIQLFEKTSKSNWKEASLKYLQEEKSLLLRRKQIENELPKYTLLSPATGELQNVRSLSVGQFIQAGESLAQLTPDTTLLAVFWVPPQKVGLLKTGLTGSFRVDAFNYNDWGFLEGTIEEISSDAYLINNQPLFRVTCSLKKDHLSLKNGFVGNLKKGMTIQGNFIVANRSLFDLLYDKVDNWINPNTL